MRWRAYIADAETRASEMRRAPALTNRHCAPARISSHLPEPGGSRLREHDDPIASIYKNSPRRDGCAV
jgi:hypothetical protein